MLTILIRTLLIYVCLIAIMRLMGKRQIGELEVTDLVTTLLISEIACLPITNREIPVIHAVLPMVILLVLEVLSSWILVRFPSLRPLVSAAPTVIIRDGKLDQRALQELRISIEELMGEIRQQGLTELAQVDCAILEKNGNVTVLPKAQFTPLTPQQLGLEAPQDHLMHVVYCNGMYSRSGLRLIRKTKAWLVEELKRRKLSVRSLFCVMADETGALYCIPKEK
ncbi:MAG: DUF421 domain-containing protein [Clostridia bacterium]|nr:DUF421 domain-containing protein [Clostridia bacterium]